MTDGLGCAGPHCGHDGNERHCEDCAPDEPCPPCGHWARVRVWCCDAKQTDRHARQSGKLRAGVPPVHQEPGAGVGNEDEQEPRQQKLQRADDDRDRLESSRDRSPSSVQRVAAQPRRLGGAGCSAGLQGLTSGRRRRHPYSPIARPPLGVGNCKHQDTSLQFEVHDAERESMEHEPLLPATWRTHRDGASATESTARSSSASNPSAAAELRSAYHWRAAAASAIASG